MEAVSYRNMEAVSYSPAYPGDMLFIQVRQAVPIPFMSTGYLGELVQREGGSIVMRNVVVVYEQVGQNRTTGDLVISTQYYSSFQLSNGLPVFNESDVLWERVVPRDGDEFIAGYNRAMEALRLERVNIKRPGPSVVKS